MPECPICLHPAARERRGSDGDLRKWECPQCGKFDQRGGAVVAMLQLASVDRTYLSAWTHNEYIRRGKPPEFDRPTVERVMANQRKRSVTEQQETLLLNLGHQSEHPGKWIPLLRDEDIGLAWALNPEELDFHVEALKAQGIIKSDGGENPRYAVTSQGWIKIAELEKPSGPESNIVFVAMSFAPELNAAWVDGIRPGLADAGYEARRADSEEHVDKIDDRIMAMIREASIVVVDVTTQNRGAYFEAGFAMGLGRPVLWSVREDDLPSVHFDTRQFNHIVWTDPADLRAKLANRVLGVFGRATGRGRAAA